MQKNRIVLIDIGIANIYNLKLGFEKIGYDVSVSSSKNEILDSTHLVLPGVGAFGEGMKRLGKKGLIDPIIDCANNGKPILGICLGMQLLFTSSEENGFYDGLNLVPGKVIHFKKPEPGNNFKIPHMNWNTIICSSSDSGNKSWENTILESVSSGAYMYFVHSLFTLPDLNENVLATTNFGYDKFCSVVKSDNITGCQFHPERSAENGLKILENFVKQK
tara:strand:- start:1919 stop:2575 length:657 start_codon:yes stop_codon:yes gene_type:complete